MQQFGTHDQLRDAIVPLKIGVNKIRLLRKCEYEDELNHK